LEVAGSNAGGRLGESPDENGHTQPDLRRRRHRRLDRLVPCQARADVIERTGLANAASGKSGDSLTLDWGDGTALAPLARRSFALHAFRRNGWSPNRMAIVASTLGRYH
jgi:hypothetical protein